MTDCKALYAEKVREAREKLARFKGSDSPAAAEEARLAAIIRRRVIEDYKTLRKRAGFGTE